VLRGTGSPKAQVKVKKDYAAYVWLCALRTGDLTARALPEKENHVGRGNPPTSIKEKETQGKGKGDPAAHRSREPPPPLQHRGLLQHISRNLGQPQDSTTCTVSVQSAPRSLTTALSHNWQWQRGCPDPYSQPEDVLTAAAWAHTAASVGTEAGPRYRAWNMQMIMGAFGLKALDHGQLQWQAHVFETAMG